MTDIAKLAQDVQEARKHLRWVRDVLADGDAFDAAADAFAAAVKRLTLAQAREAVASAEEAAPVGTRHSTIAYALSCLDDLRGDV